MIFRLAAPRTTFLTAVSFFIDRGPGAPFGFLARYSAVLIAFLDMFGLTLLLVGITGLVATGHGALP
ncbi:hypothetical protein JQ636_25035 [Bradyrhizobium japonicum]|nr:hypothetical protein [Bradyrhizobium japonicum]